MKSPQEEEGDRHLPLNVAAGNLGDALNDLLVAIQRREQTAGLNSAAQRFDPSYCEDTEHEDDANAVRILIEMLVDISTGSAPVTVAQQLLSLDPLPPLSCANLARGLIRIGDHWPNHCQSCGCVQPPTTFDCDRCPNCRDITGRLGTLAQYLRRCHVGDGANCEEPDVLFPFWSDMRRALRAAYPGLRKDYSLFRHWTTVLENEHNLDAGTWQYIEFQQAMQMLPRPAVDVSTLRSRPTEDGNGHRETERKPERRPTVNARMKAMLASDLETVKGWTAREWAAALGCARSTVIETETWKSMSLLRQQMKAERKNDRRRR